MHLQNNLPSLFPEWMAFPHHQYRIDHLLHQIVDVDIFGGNLLQIGEGVNGVFRNALKSIPELNKIYKVVDELNLNENFFHKIETLWKYPLAQTRKMIYINRR